MGYDVMAAWEKRSFDYGSDRGNSPQYEDPRTSRDYMYNAPRFSPTFCNAVSRWSPVASPTSPVSPKTTLPQPSRASSVRADSAMSDTFINPFDSKALGHQLYAASAAGDLQHVKLLISLGAPINATTTVPNLYEAFKPAKPGFLSPLAGAASSGQMHVVEYLVSQGAEVTPDVNTSSSSPLQLACRANSVAVADYLLQKGADVNQINCYKSTPLMYAVKYGSPELVNLILAYRPDLTATSFMGSTAAHWAIWPGRLDVLELLLRAGANPDDQLADESTLLHCAALSGWADGIRLLVRCGADPMKRDADWKTPLDMAVAHEHADAVAILKAAMLLNGTP